MPELTRTGAHPSGSGAAGRPQPFAWLIRAATDLRSDVRYAVRTWIRQPGFVLVAVISLACGIGLNTAVFSVINAIFLQGIRGVPGGDRIVSLGERVPFTTFRDVRESITTLNGLAAWQPVAVDLRVRDAIVRGAVPAVSDGYFATLGVLPLRGRFFAVSNDRVPRPTAEVVLDYEFWIQQLAGDPAVIGESILVNRVPATIVGIAPREFHGFGPQRPPLWIPIGMLPAVRGVAARWDDPAESGWRMFGRLDTHGSVGQINAELRTLAARTPLAFPNGPLTGSTGAEGWTGAVSAEKRIEFLLVVVMPLVIAGLILWIGCSNVANLLLARAASRRKEIAIRLANGATRSRLVRLLLTESLLLAVAGGALGILIAVWTLDLVWLTLPDAPQLAIDLDTHVLIYTGAVAIAATLLFGLIPALHATRVDVAPLLKGAAATPHADVRRGARVRRFFLVTQFASSMALLVVAGTFVRAIVATHGGDKSMPVDHLTIAYNETVATSASARAAHWRTVREQLQRLPDVTDVTLIEPSGPRRSALVPAGADPAAAQLQADVQNVDSEFFRASGTVVVAGRTDLQASAAGDSARGVAEPAVINERAASRFWGSTGVLGRRFALGDAPLLEVVGIVRDDEVESRVFRALRDGDLTNANVIIRSTRPADRMVEPVRALLASLDRDATFVRVTTLRDAQTGSLARIMRLAVIIAGIVLALATVGLYGSISFVTSQRTREIAIRIAVGAPGPAVLRLVAREGLLVVSIGSLLGLSLIAVAFRFMSGMIFATWTLDPLTIAVVLATFSLATLGACYLPGRRAMRLDPMHVLRAE
ncbi:MAG: FtsX-like permease family protein [Acidobacteriota bacterium]